MKKLIFSLLSFVVISSQAFAFTNPPEPTVIAEKKGVSGRKQGDQAAVVVLVRNSHSAPSTATINSGDAVVWDTNSDDGVTVRHTTTSADGAFAGIAVTAILSSDATSGTSAQDDAGLRNWGYILVHGKTHANVTAGGTNGQAIGGAMITSTDAGKVTSIEQITTNDPTGLRPYVRAIGNRGGFFYDAADTSSTSVEVQVTLE